MGEVFTAIDQLGDLEIALIVGGAALVPVLVEAIGSYREHRANGGAGLLAAARRHLRWRRRQRRRAFAIDHGNRKRLGR